MRLFKRASHGLKLTEAGDMLWTHCERAFGELRAGLGMVAGVRGRELLTVAVARSYATRVLSRRVASFTESYPWIRLVFGRPPSPLRSVAETRRTPPCALAKGIGATPNARSSKTIRFSRSLHPR